MANHKSSEKRARQTIKKTERNRFYRTRLKNLTRDVRESVQASDMEMVEIALKKANKEIHSFVSKGFLKKQSAARRVSRLFKLAKTIEINNI